MNNKFCKRLNEFLENETVNYGLEYKFKSDDDGSHCTVTIQNKKCYSEEKSIDVDFMYDEEKDKLSIDMYDYNREEVTEYDYTVKYFWMKIAPVFFK